LLEGDCEPESNSGAGRSDGFWQVPVEMAALAKRGDQPTSEQVDVLRSYLELRTLTFARADADARLVSSVEPGYLETSSHDRRVFVPFHLARFFPSQETLDEAVTVARLVAAEAANPICISGSTTFLKALPAIGDLDFCEYHMGAPQRLAERVCTKTQAQDGPPLVEVKCGEHYHHPWAGLETALRGKLGTARASDAEPVKLDFISVSGLGTLPTTSLILPVEGDPEAGNAGRTFTYQEAVICDSAPPRTLLKPESMGHYVNWLIGDAEGWLDEDSPARNSKRGPKALKRLLSVALLLGETALVDEVVTGLQTPVMQDITIKSRVDELKGMMAHLPECVSNLYVNRLQDDLDSLAMPDEDIEIALLELIGLGKELLEEVQLLLSADGGEA